MRSFPWWTLPALTAVTCMSFIAYDSRERSSAKLSQFEREEKLTLKDLVPGQRAYVPYVDVCKDGRVFLFGDVKLQRASESDIPVEATDKGFVLYASETTYRFRYEGKCLSTNSLMYPVAEIK